MTGLSGANLVTETNLTHPTIDPNTNRFAGGQGYVFDKNGNLTTDAENRSFVFNGDNKQREIKDASGHLVGEYFYDGEGKRVKKKTYQGGELDEETVFVYSSGKLIAEYSSKPPAQNPTTQYTITDQLGSPRVLVNTLGAVVSRRDFLPFGEEIVPDAANLRTDAPLKYNGDGVRQKFTGYQHDEETGLDFAEARMYQNKHGRFTAPDPLLASASATNPQTFNRYVYTGNNPVNFTDPGGMKWCRIKGGTQMEFTGEGAPCQDGWDPVDKSYGTVSPDGDFSDVSENGPAGPGTIIYFNSNGTIRVADPTNSTDAAGIAAVTGTEVRSTMEEIVETTASIITDFGAGVIQGIAGSACMGQCDALNPRHTDTIPQRIGQGVGTAIDFGLGGVALDLGAKGSGAALVGGVTAEALVVTVPLAVTGVVLMAGSTIYASEILKAGMPTHWTRQSGIQENTRGTRPRRTAPVDDANGPHTTVKKDADGNITGTETWKPNPKNPKGWDSDKRVDNNPKGKPHKGVPTPHTTRKDRTRPARKWEVPK